MPLIDPGRLLKTLAPLLEPSTGAIKSEKEVDKIYGLMSKFSKKLVSKCTYLNILKASEPDVLDLFLQRGGWDMVLGWTEDANIKKNYEVLKEIGELLLHAPASVQRLKENELPKLIKSLSKDCENHEIREIAKKIVAKWIAIAKQQQDHPTQLKNSDAINSGTVVSNNNPAFVHEGSGTLNSNNILGTTGLTMVNNENQEFDIAPFDISHAEFNEMIEFNPEDFTNAMNTNLSEFSSGATVSRPNDVVNNENRICLTNTVEMATSSSSDPPRAPKLLIKTVKGQKAVVNNVAEISAHPIVVPEPIKQEEAPFCIMMKDGKPFLVRLKLASVQEVNKLGQFQPPSINHDPTTSAPSEAKVRRPRKDPTITAMKTAIEGRHIPAILKTYSKKNADMVAVPERPEPLLDSSAVPKTQSPSKEIRTSEEKVVKKSKSKSGSKSGSAAAAAAAKKQADEEKLKDKIKQEKIMLKKRAKEAAKQKQQDKDQETLKKLNLTGEPTNTSPTSMKIPKIPKKQSSFADAIGIPGTSDVIASVSEKSSSSSSSSSTKKSNHESTDSNKKSLISGKKDDLEKVSGEVNNERRHRVKVFTSKKSRADDLLKDMTENAHNNKINKSNEPPKESVLMGEKSLAGNSLILKPEKRPSIEGIEKPGDAKKQKISDDKLEKRKESSSTKSKDKNKPAVKVIKESSLFMDALAASSEPTKKRKRRLSSSNEKEKEIVPLGKAGRSNSFSKDKPTSPPLNTPNEAVKPVFNFYRETLEDSGAQDENEDEITIIPSEENAAAAAEDDPMEVEILGGDKEKENYATQDAFLPSEDELRLKSALVIVRSKNKPKKSVRWREDDEIKEIFTFELNEDERVNVTKLKDFSAMKEHEKAEEKEYLVKSLKRRILGEEEAEERMLWRKPILIFMETQRAACISEEKQVQEERERLNLGVFLPPGSLLPDTPTEPDSSQSNSEDRTETRVIPLEDVINVTKVYDKRDQIWPIPEVSPIRARMRSSNMQNPNDHHAFGGSNFNSVGDVGLNSNPSLHIQGFNNPPPPPIDFSNPWTMMGMSGNVGDVSGFTNAGNISMLTSVPPPPVGFPPNIPFGFPLQNPVPNFPPPNMNFSGHPNPMGLANNNNNNPGRDVRSHSQNSSNRGRVGGSGRDYGDRDLRRNDSRSSRDSYESRSKSSRDYRSRDHDRDRRSPSPSSRRRRDDRDRYGRDDKDYRDHDFRSRGRSGKKDIPCRFFRKGHCNSGSNCEFSHGEPSSSNNDTYHDKRSSSKESSSRPSGRQLSPSLLTGHEDSGHSSSTNSINSQYERRPSRDETEATNFSDAPSSPMNEIAEDPSLLLTKVSEPAKIIPVE